MNVPALLIAQTAPQTPSAMTMLFPAALMAMVVFMILSSRSQKKREKRERDEMHANMSRNDRVLTIGGIIGTVLSVKENEVVLKVDESTNTKMSFVKSAIQRIVTDEQSLVDDKK